jgi:hypothetical protein
MVFPQKVLLVCKQTKGLFCFPASVAPSEVEHLMDEKASKYSEYKAQDSSVILQYHHLVTILTAEQPKMAQIWTR